MRDLWQHFVNKYHDMNIDEVGIQQFEPSESYQYVAYQNFILHYVEKGKGMYEVGGRTYHLKAGDGFIIKQGVSVSYSADPKNPWKNYWVGFNGEELTSHLSNTSLLENVVLSFEENSISTKLVKEICDQTLKESPNRIKDSWYLGKIYQLLYHLSEEFIIEDGHQNIDNKDDHKYAKIAFDYIDNNYMVPITIQGIADYIGIDRSYLFRTFKKEYNLSPHQFLLKYRMKTAKKLLLETEENIYIISEKVGYNDQLQFSKAFKNIYGLSPSNYRKRFK